eukprot:3581643-Pyramimonas_sp.AAC.1
MCSSIDWFVCSLVHSGFRPLGDRRRDGVVHSVPGRGQSGGVAMGLGPLRGGHDGAAPRAHVWGEGIPLVITI